MFGKSNQQGVLELQLLSSVSEGKKRSMSTEKGNNYNPVPPRQKKTELGQTERRKPNILQIASFITVEFSLLPAYKQHHAFNHQIKDSNTLDKKMLVKVNLSSSFLMSTSASSASALRRMTRSSKSPFDPANGLCSY